MEGPREGALVAPPARVFAPAVRRRRWPTTTMAPRLSASRLESGGGIRASLWRLPYRTFIAMQNMLSSAGEANCECVCSPLEPKALDSDAWCAIYRALPPPLQAASASAGWANNKSVCPALAHSSRCKKGRGRLFCRAHQNHWSRRSKKILDRWNESKFTAHELCAGGASREPVCLARPAGGGGDALGPRVGTAVGAECSLIDSVKYFRPAPAARGTGWEMNR